MPLVPKEDLRRSLEAATEEYQKQLLDDDHALTWLDSRGITSEAQDYFRIGLVKEPLKGDEDYRGRLSFPYIKPSGVVAIRFRSMNPESSSKMLAHAGDEGTLYNTAALLGTKEIYICEGETDTITAYQAGLRAVGLPGASSWAPNRAEFRCVFRNRIVKVLQDNDDEFIEKNSGKVRRPGQELAKDIYKTLGGCQIIAMPRGHDVNSYAMEYGLDALREYVSGPS